MTIDASIPLGAKTDYGNPLDTAAKALTLKHLMTLNDNAPMQAQADALKLQGAQLDVNSKQQTMEKQKAVTAAFQDSFDPQTGRLDESRALSNLYKADPEYASKWATDRAKQNTDFREGLQKSHKNFVDLAGPLSKTIVGDYDKQIASGIPPDVAEQSLRPRIGSAFEMMTQAGFGGEFHGGDPNSVTIDQLRGVAGQWGEGMKIDARAAGSGNQDRMFDMQSRRLDLEERRLNDSENNPGGTSKGWQIWQDKEGNLKRVNPNTNEITDFKEGTQDLKKVSTGGTGAMGSRESVFIQRVLTAGNQASKGLLNVSKLPISSDTGLFGGRHQGGSLFAAGKEVLSNEMTSQDAQRYNVLSAGFQRSLAAIEAAGLAPSGSLSHQMDAVIFKAGDSNLTKLYKMAETRQIVEAGFETILNNPRVSAGEKDHAQAILNNIKEAVPFTNENLIDLEKNQEANPDSTLQDVLKAQSKAPAAAPSQPAASVHDMTPEEMRAELAAIKAKQ